MRLERGALEQCEELTGKYPDILICSASFESRCLSIPHQFRPTGLSKAIVCEQREYRAWYGSNGARLRALFGELVEVLTLDTAAPLQTADLLISELGSHVDDLRNRIFVDITTFTHETLLILFRILYDRRGLENVVFGYAPASDYSVGDPPGRKWLSKGLGEIRSVLGYSGMMLPSKKLHLVLLVGLEHQRAAELIARYGPSKISLGYTELDGVEGRLSSDVGQIGFSRIGAIFSNSESFSFPCFDPQGTRESLLKVIDKESNYNTVIAAMNTKLSAIGAARLACENTEIQLCYAQALVYNYKGYSEPGPDMIVLEYSS